MAHRYSIVIRVANNVKVSYDHLTGYWNMSNDEVTWKRLPNNLKKMDTIVSYAAKYYGVSN